MYFTEKYGPATNVGKMLGNDTLDDAYNYRGAGAIQLTGRYNYQQFSNYIENKTGQLDPNIMEKWADYVGTVYFWEAAGVFWKQHDIGNNIAKGATSYEISEIVNKYDVGTFEERKAMIEEAYEKITAWQYN